MSIRYLSSSKIENKTVLVRGSVDVPIDEKTGKVADDFRLKSFLPTVEKLLRHGNKVIICGKLGRPDGKKVSALSLRPVAQRFAHLLGMPFVTSEGRVAEKKRPYVVFYSGDILDKKHQQQILEIPGNHVVFLENLEYYEQELENKSELARALATVADVYVNDDFTKAHHLVASNGAITKYLPSYAGPLLEQEIKSLTPVLGKNPKPFVLLMGGIKISDKIDTLKNLGEKADKILLGGGLATLMFLSKGYEIGLSKVEKEGVKTAWQLEKNFKSKIMLPADVVVANKDMDKSSIRVTTPYEVGKKEVILDCGPETILLYAKELKKAKTIVWNGPLGHYEVKPFHTATMALARIIGAVASRKAYGVVGGGETVDAVRQCHQFDHIDHVSTGGGAMLEFLAGKKLPAIEVLR